MTLRDSTKARTELDKLKLVEPEEDQFDYIDTLIREGDKVHIEVHMDALEGDYPTLDTRAVRGAL